MISVTVRAWAASSVRDREVLAVVARVAEDCKYGQHVFTLRRTSQLQRDSARKGERGEEAALTDDAVVIGRRHVRDSDRHEARAEVEVSDQGLEDWDRGRQHQTPLM